MGLAFKKAERKQIKLRLALIGPSGAGKTYSALLIASGMAKKIAVIDTENNRASLYVGLEGMPEFDVIPLEPPYTIDKYLEAINAAIEAKYDLLVIDSISHAWAGEGGLLEKKGALDIRGGNSYTNWAPVTKEHEKFKAALLHSPLHLMVTMRSKQDYVLEVNDKGKSAPRKVGLAPIQRDGMEYEFDMVLDLAMDHNASVSKTRMRDFDGKIFTPGKKTGESLLAWLNEGIIPQPETVPLAVHKEDHPKPDAPAPAEFNAEGKRLITPKQRARLFAILKESGKTQPDFKAFLADAVGVDTTAEITMDDYDQVCAWVQG